MSNIQTVRELIGALERGDEGAFLEPLAGDVRWEYHPPGNTAQEQDVPYMRYREPRARGEAGGEAGVVST